MTSANTTNYIIRNQSGERVGEHHQHSMCKCRWASLLKFQPLEDHTIQPTWYDEEESHCEGDRMNLKEFMLRVACSTDKIAKQIASHKKFTYDEALDRKIRSEFHFKDSEKHYAAMKKFVTDNFK